MAHPFGTQLIIVANPAHAHAIRATGRKALCFNPNGGWEQILTFSPSSKEWALATDVDGYDEYIMAFPEGLEGLRDDMGLRLGDDRCKYVLWPTLRDGEKLSLTDLLAIARPMWTDEVCKLSDVPEPGEELRYESGFSSLDEHGFRITLPAFMSLIGPYGSGKSVLLRQLLCNLWRLHKFKFLLTSFEERIKPRYRRDLRRNFLNGLTRAKDGQIVYPQKIVRLEDWTDKDVLRADAEIEQAAVFLRRKRGTILDLEHLINRIEFAVRVYGIRVVAVDPVNEIDHQIPRGESMTEYLRKFIMNLKALADDYGLLVIVCAHPPKEAVEKRMHRNQVLTLNDGADCYSEDTEVLSERGWLRYDDLTSSDRVACFDLVRDTCSWQLPERKVVYDYVGQMAHFSGPSIDMLVTPNHRMVVKPRWKEPVGGDGMTGRPRRWPKDVWQFCQAKDLNRLEFKVPLARQMQGGDEPAVMSIGAGYPMVPFLKFLGWYLAEGYWQGVSIGICQATGSLQLAMASCMRNELGLPFSETIQTYENRNEAYLPTWKARVRKRESPEIVEWMRANCGRNCATKRVPDFVWSLSARLQRVLLEAFIDGDGYRPSNRRGCKAVTTSAQLIDDLQRLAVLCGLPSSASLAKSSRPEHSPQWEINFGDPDRRDISLRASRHLSWVPYDGKVWCLTVPTGAFVTRRNGRVAFQGNSAHWGNKSDIGWCVWRRGLDKNAPTYLHLDKLKDHETMGETTLAELMLNKDAGAFTISRMGYEILAEGDE